MPEETGSSGTILISFFTLIIFSFVSRNIPRINNSFLYGSLRRNSFRTTHEMTNLPGD